MGCGDGLQVLRSQRNMLLGEAGSALVQPDAFAAVERIKEIRPTPDQKMAGQPDTGDRQAGPQTDKNVNERERDRNAQTGVEDFGQQRIIDIVVILLVASEADFGPEKLDQRLDAIDLRFGVLQ